MQQYDQFVDKFKPRHTSDDTHTPPNVYAAVLAWCERRYGIDRAKVLRPFFPGGDYATADYPAGCVVIDNPPFSILAQIVRIYLERKVQFFIFAQSLTMLGHARHPGCAAVFCGNSLTFDNGANVSVGFLTSLEGPDVLAVAAPDLGDALEECEKENRKIGKRHVTPLALPEALLTGGRMNYLAVHHTPHTVRRSEAAFVRRLDNYPGGIFGGGFLLSERAAAERAAAGRAAAHKVELSAREREIVKNIGKQISLIVPGTVNREDVADGAVPGVSPQRPYRAPKPGCEGQGLTVKEARQ